MSKSADRVDTRDVAALLAATDDQGNVDPIEFEAERLILRNHRVGGIDAVAMTDELQAAAIFQTPERADLLEAIFDRLETSSEKRRLAAALSAAGISDASVKLHDGAASEEADASDYSAEKFEQALNTWSNTGRECLRVIANNADVSRAERNAADAALSVLGEQETLQSVVDLNEAARAIGGFDDLARIAFRIATCPDWYKMIVGLAKLDAIEAADERGKPLSERGQAASDALDMLKIGLTEARAKGSERDFLGGFAGIVGVELVVRLEPAERRVKYGKSLRALELLLGKSKA
ncbi:hypothetical protein [Lysobacter sp. CA196]|uniref:hypothetical protein n=1 Tax=Lysobacter sp. CA196 TaxID=3455606 RepID=UPI003F8D88D0